MPFKSYTAVFALLLLASCASYKIKYGKSGQNWQQDSVAVKTSLTHTMYLVGDAGNDQPNDPAPVLNYLERELKGAPANSSIVFLGDNIYEYGMPPKEDEENRKNAEQRILSQLQVLDSFKGRPVFLPGNHDWRGWGLKGLKREEKFIESYLNKLHKVENKDDWENYFMPNDGCSGVEILELTNDVVLLVVDSEWWIRDWDKEPGLNDGCEVKNRAAFKFAFENVLRKYRNKQVVVAMHHPLFTYGSHGGGFSAKQHLFPLTDLNEDLYIPLPVVGTLAAGYRTAIGSRQDMGNQHYRDLKKAILSAAKKNGQFIFAAGHEHALQYIEQDSQSIIVSGSGSKTSPVKLGKGSFFGSGHPGFSSVSFYDNGDMLIRFYEVNADGSKAVLVFQHKTSKPRLEYKMADSSFAFYNTHADSTVQYINKEPVGPTGGLENFAFGEHYRAVYIPQYTFPVLDLKQFNGGVTPSKLGGGNQTNSLRVKDKAGKDYVIRGLDKEVTRFLPFPFNRISTAKYLVKNNFLSTHPFAPMAVASLANAVDVYHTNPSLYYVPAQPALQEYNAVFGNAMALVEERPAGKKWEEAAWFGHPKKIIATDELLESLLEDNKYKVDQSWALRSRMLDWIVGDWDRHDDQWAWAAIELNDQNVYRPIPRDRDQAFSKYDGLAAGLARFTLPFLRQLQVYGPSIANKKWNTWSARLFDRSFLTELSRQQWEEQALYIQQHLTDSAIDHAFDSWPATARELTAGHFKKSIRQRRDDLLWLAKTHYEFVSETVSVVGTDEKERFLVDRIDDDHTAVTVLEISKDGTEKKQNYHRIFENDITKFINLYGNGSGDEFIVRGNVKRSISIRAIGGQGKDLFIDSSKVKRGGKKTLVYDDLRENTIRGGRETRDLRTSRYQYNIYDRRDYSSEYNIVLPMPIVGYNPDDGVLIGARFDMTRYGFKKEPYKSRQIFGGAFAFGTKSAQLQYVGDFLSAFGNLDFFLAAHYHGPNFAFNYAGIGNDTKRPIDDPNYYRVRQSDIYLYPAIKKRFGINGFVSMGPFLQINQVEDTDGRFITDSAGSLKQDIFDQKYYSGGRLLFNINSIDNQMLPHSGVKFRASFDYFENLQTPANFLAFRGDFSFYTALDANENLVLASQFGAGINMGDGYEFFQMATIGGDEGMRGYRTERFYGKSCYWQSTDLRIRFGSSQNITLPFTLGMFAGFDYGRVWDNEYPSNTWHYDYGGGLWFAPVDLLTLCVGAFVPAEADEEKPRVTLKLGFSF